MGPIVIVGGCATCESALCIHATIDAFSKPKLPNIRYDVSKSLCDTRAAVFPRYGYVVRRRKRTNAERRISHAINFNLKTGCAAAAPGRPFPARGRAPRGAPQKRRPRSTNTMTNTNQDGPSMPPDCIRMCAYVIRMQVSTGYIVPKRLHSICTVSRYSQRFFVSPFAPPEAKMLRPCDPQVFVSI